jgi:hypothetical protein
MTIIPLKCGRCNKLNCQKLYTCVHCEILQCKSCLDKTNPKRLRFRILKNNKIGIEKTIYCINHCIKTKKFCNDCGNNYTNLNSCKRCDTFFCSNCNNRHNLNISNYFKELDTKYNRELVKLSKYYCSENCLTLDIYNNTQLENICNKCGIIFIDSCNEGECYNCVKRIFIELDLKYNRKREQLQNKIMKLINTKIISKEEVIETVGVEMKNEISKNKYMIENMVSFLDWVNDIDEGYNRCLLMYDNCIIKILKQNGYHKLKDYSF